MIIIDVALFRIEYPAFKDPVKYPDEMIQLKGQLAQGFIGTGCLLKGEKYRQVIYLMTAHLMWSEHLLQIGQTTVGVMTGATIDKVSVTMQPPPIRTGWQYWLSTTPYGTQLWAFLMIQAAGGWYVGGLPERKAFRKVAGTFR